MAIINKDKYLKDIASRVQKGAMYFEAEDRPEIVMGGRKVFISSVAFDPEREELTYRVTNRQGEILPSQHGERPLSVLDVKILSGVDNTVRQYAALRVSREKNLVNIEARIQDRTKSFGRGL